MMRPMMRGSHLLWVVALLLLVAAALLPNEAECQQQQPAPGPQDQNFSVESRQQKDDELMQTVKLLESIDKIYSDVRPRFGRGGLQMDAQRRQTGGRSISSLSPPLLVGGGELAELGGQSALLELLRARLAPARGRLLPLY